MNCARHRHRMTEMMLAAAAARWGCGAGQAGIISNRPPDGWGPDHRPPPPQSGGDTNRRSGSIRPASRRRSLITTVRLRFPALKALDTNHDGILDAQEIANAPAALLTLDKNGIVQLTPDEFAPPRPKGRHHRPPPPPDDNAPDDKPETK